MNSQPLVSVIVPVYNVEKYLRKCIESIIKQRYQYLQIILIDDGSTDGSGKICDEYAMRDERIEVIHQVNGGRVNARKTGLLLAQGEYVGFVDADDYVEADFYLSMITIMVEKNVDFVHSGYVIEKGILEEICAQYEGGVYDISHKQAEFISSCVFNINNDTHMPHNLWSKLFKTDLVKACFMQIPDCQEWGEDMLCICLCTLKSNKIFLSTTIGYHYVIRDESITHNATMENVIGQGALYSILLDTFSRYGKLEIVRKELEHYFKDFLMNFLALQLKADNILLYKYADIKSLRGKKVVLHCAGRVGQDYYAQMSKYKDIKIVAWADKHYENYKFDYREVIGIEMVSNYDFDILVIAVLNKFLADEIKRDLVASGVQESKIVWKQPVRILQDAFAH